MSLDAILKDPSAVYKKPEDVLTDNNLSRDEKFEVLAQWEYDARELLVATEENMPGTHDSWLEKVLEAKHKLEQGD